MSKLVINKTFANTPSIDFTIARNDAVALSNYHLYTSESPKKAAGDYTFSNAYFIPLQTLIKFTPVFSGLMNNNTIIQCKWSFGDGEEKFMSLEDTPTSAVYHMYTFNLDSSFENISVKNTCTYVTLTAIDSYQQVFRCQKTIYPKAT